MDKEELIQWLSLDHDVRTNTKSEADYWANQFCIACKHAKELTK